MNHQMFPLNLDWISFRVPFEVKPSNFDGNELLSTFYCRFWVCRTSAWVHVHLYWCRSINWIPSTDSTAHLLLIFHVIYQIGRGPRVDWSGENPICLGDKRLIMIADSYWGNLANSIRCSWTNMAMCPSTTLEQH